LVHDAEDTEEKGDLSCTNGNAGVGWIHTDFGGREDKTLTGRSPLRRLVM